MSRFGGLQVLRGAAACTLPRREQDLLRVVPEMRVFFTFNSWQSLNASFESTASVRNPPSGKMDDEETSLCPRVSLELTAQSVLGRVSVSRARVNAS